jgi:hypothetical protein
MQNEELDMRIQNGFEGWDMHRDCKRSVKLFLENANYNYFHLQKDQFQNRNLNALAVFSWSWRDNVVASGLLLPQCVHISGRRVTDEDLYLLGVTRRTVDEFPSHAAPRASGEQSAAPCTPQFSWGNSFPIDRELHICPPAEPRFGFCTADTREWHLQISPFRPSVSPKFFRSCPLCH